MVHATFLFMFAIIALSLVLTYVFFDPDDPCA